MTPGLKVRHYRVLELLDADWSYEEIARTFNVSVERVRQIEAEAMALLEKRT